jgi:hypothetical protein
LFDFAGSEVAKKIKMPIFVVSDAIDVDVAVSCALNIRQNLKNGTLYLSSGLGHAKILRDKEVTNKIVNFIIKTHEKIRILFFSNPSCKLYEKYTKIIQRKKNVFCC